MPDKPAPPRITVKQEILPLPGSLDSTPFFSSNCPEIVLESGILLSTFPGEGKAHPDAHLNHPLNGKFDIFFHHITNATKTGGGKHTLYLGMIIGNASKEKVHVQILQAVSHLTKPDSPFKDLDTVLDNEKGSIYAGPGDRVMLDLLRQHKQSGWHSEITLDPGEMKMLYELPLPVKSLLHPLNGRTGLIRLSTDGPVYLANLSTFSKKKLFGEHKPDFNTWKDVLQKEALVQPRDKPPSAPGAKGHLVYGRVAGVAKGSTWLGKVTSAEAKDKFALKPNQMISFPINSVAGGTFGTNQIQAAPMTVRYHDTAYQSNGNYGVLYDLNIPLYNESNEPITVGLSFQSPIKDWNTKQSLQFFTHPPEQITFRGTVSFEWTDDMKKHHQQFTHLVEKRGQAVHPLIEFLINPNSLQDVRFKFLYPADCTPPHVLTITTVTQPH